MSAALAGWRKPLAHHDPAKAVLDLAITLAVGGDAMSDIATVPAEPALYGSAPLRLSSSTIRRF